ncbi:hypothetical protein [Leucobacter sp. cx-169]|uniref:hypothetical protein n=1 Tax=Leucobacter sp. cx-169 TaxID=2770549 RepID=UPI00165DC4EC|nr:hypothetical protein [Leucobacter sp. cx-169]MBC9927186.1 hypothetical protein [Leucobacter sp. cx-169]
MSRILLALLLFVLAGTIAHWWTPAAEILTALRAQPQVSAFLLLVFFAFIAFVSGVYRMMRSHRRRGLALIDRSGIGATGIATAAPRLEDAELAIVTEHEARHAVVAHHFGHTVTRLSAVPYGREGGNVQYDYVSDDLSGVDQRWSIAVTSLAGAAACPPFQQDDDQKALSMFVQILASGQRPTMYDGAMDLSSMISAGLTLADSIVELERPAAEALAAALAEKRILGREEIAAVFAENASPSRISRCFSAVGPPERSPA